MTDHPPPAIAAPRNTPGVLVFVGLSGIVAAIGAASSGFLQQLARTSAVEYAWGDTLRFAAVFAFAGGVLAMFQHEIGIPIVIGSMTPIVAVVATVLAGMHFKTAPLLDPYPGRGLLFIGAGVVGVIGLIVGLVGLRGSGTAGFGVPVALLSLASVAATAGLFRLDKVRDAQQVRPFLGYAFIGLVCIVCSFAGRFGLVAAAVASTTIVWTFIDTIEFSGTDRRWVAIVDVLALAAVLTLSLGAAAVASRRVEEVTWETHPAFEPAVFPTSPVPTTRYTPEPVVYTPVTYTTAATFAPVPDVFIAPAVQPPVRASGPQPIQAPAAADPPTIHQRIVEPLVEPAVEPVVEPAVEPVVEPAVEPVVEPAVASVAEPTIGPEIGSADEPLIDATPTQLDIAPVPEPEPAAAPAPEPVAVEPEPEPVVEPTGVVRSIVLGDPAPASRSTDVRNTTAVSAIGQWAGDPYGRHELRYWDGRRWTEQVRNGDDQSVDPV